MAYRSFYKNKKPNKNSFSIQSSLKQELQKLQSDLQNLQERSPVARQNNNYAELESFFMNKFILIGGCVLFGLGIGYLIYNNRRRC